MSDHEFDLDADWVTEPIAPFVASDYAWQEEAAARIWNYVISSPASSFSGAHPVRIATGNETRKHELPRVPNSGVSYSGALHSWIKNESLERLSVRDAILKAEKANLL